MKTVRIPRRFYEDHAERDLPTPAEVKGNKRSVWIQIGGSDENTSAVQELLDDADFYSDPHDFLPHCFGLCMSAKRTAELIREAMA